MLNFKNASLFFITLIISLSIAQIIFGIPWYLYTGIALVYFLLLVYGSYNVGSNFYLKVVCSGKTSEKLIAITFDDGPVQEFTPGILHVLQQYKVPATFFCIGKRIVQNESLLCQLHQQGHIIGNHSYSHSLLFDFMSRKRMLRDVQMANQTIHQLIGLQPKLFRPPFGVTTPVMRNVMETGKYMAIGWSIRSMDTITTNENKLLKKLIRLLKPGAIILLHDTQKVTLSVLPHFIQAARNEGYEFIRLDKLLNVQVYA